MLYRLTKREGDKVYFAEWADELCKPHPNFCEKARKCNKIKDRSCPTLMLIDRLAEYEDKIERGELVEANGNEDIETVNRPCAVCRKIKNGKEFEVRDDNARIQKITHIAYCPYCGRFLSEHYGGERSVDSAND